MSAMRVFDRRGDIFGTMTPLKGLTFVYERIYLNKFSDGEVWYEFMEWADNPYLSKREIAALTASMDESAAQQPEVREVCGGGGRGWFTPNSTSVCM